RVGVTHQRDRPKWHGIPCLPAQRTLPANLFDPGLDLAHAVSNPAPVRLEFLFARAPYPDATRSTAYPANSASAALTAETGHRRTLSGQPRQQIIELRQFHLQLSFPAARMPRENVENELRPIDDAACGGRFDIALLHGREITVEDDQRSTVRRGLRSNLIEFAAPDECRRIGLLANLEHCARDFRACASRQFDQLGE